VTDEDGVAPVASSAIRAALRHGNVAAAARQLGYWWTVLGDVVPGDGRGRDLGYPTANLVLEPGCEPKEGIYAARVRIDDEPGRPARAGAAYIGTRPTFSTTRRFLEVHLLDYAGDLYGRKLAVEFTGFIRPDQAFEGAEALKRQMDADCRAIAAMLDDLARNDPMLRYPLGRLQAGGCILGAPHFDSVRPTASLQPASLRDRTLASMAGSNRRSAAQRLAKSCGAG
jgi:riboflavin kinase / FMN adenylyltransferase